MDVDRRYRAGVPMVDGPVSMADVPVPMAVPMVVPMADVPVPMADVPLPMMAGGIEWGKGRLWGIRR